MGVSQSHCEVRVPEHPRDSGQGNAPGDGLAGYGVPEIVQPQASRGGRDGGGSPPRLMAPEETEGFREAAPRRMDDKVDGAPPVPRR